VGRQPNAGQRTLFVENEMGVEHVCTGGSLFVNKKKRWLKCCGRDFIGRFY